MESIGMFLQTVAAPHIAPPQVCLKVWIRIPDPRLPPSLSASCFFKPSNPRQQDCHTGRRLKTRQKLIVSLGLRSAPAPSRWV